MSKKAITQNLLKALIFDNKVDDMEAILEALGKAYDSGFSSKKCKDDKDDYHIDPKRQTKIEF